MNRERFQRAILDAVDEWNAREDCASDSVVTAWWRRAATTLPLDTFHPPLDVRVFMHRRGERAIDSIREVNGDGLHALYQADPAHAIQRLHEAIGACIADCEAKLQTTPKRKGTPMQDEEDLTPVTVKQNTLDGKYYVWETEYADDGAVAVLDSEPTADDLRALHPTYVRS